MGRLGEFILRRLSRDPQGPDYAIEHYEEKHMDVDVYMRKLVNMFPSIQDSITQRVVLSAGCAEGMESLAIAKLGAREVVGVDIRIDSSQNRRLMEQYPDSRVSFCRTNVECLSFPDGAFDIVVTCGSLEHFNDPSMALGELRRVLKDDGIIYLTSGVWAHPWGSHMNFFTKVPWVQFFFSEATIMKVRSLYRHDGATRYSEVEGGLNNVGVRAFKRMVSGLKLKTEYLALVPVRGLHFLTRLNYVNEFFTSLIVATLSKRVEKIPAAHTRR